MTRRTAIQFDLLFTAEGHRAKLDRLDDPLQEMEPVIDLATLATKVGNLKLELSIKTRRNRPGLDA